MRALVALVAIAAIVAIVAIGCGTRGQPAELKAYLSEVAAMAPAVRTETIAGWKLDRATWDRIVVPPFTALYDEYARGFAIEPFSGPIATSRHFAGDPDLSLGQARTRWLLPVLFPSEVATAGGAPIDAVFLRQGDRWYAVTGIERVIRARIDRRDPACSVTIDARTASKACRDVAWAVAEATLRNDDTRFHRACAIATTACATSSP